MRVCSFSFLLSFSYLISMLVDVSSQQIKHVLVQSMVDTANKMGESHQRYCCLKKLRGSSGQVPIAKQRGTYLICWKQERFVTTTERDVRFYG